MKALFLLLPIFWMTSARAGDFEPIPPLLEEIQKKVEMPTPQADCLNAPLKSCALPKDFASLENIRDSTDLGEGIARLTNLPIDPLAANLGVPQEL